MTDDRIKEELRSLSRHQASPGFTRRVLEHLDEPTPRPSWVPVALAGATVGLATLLLVVALGLQTGTGNAPEMVPGPMVRLTPAPRTAAGVDAPEASPAGDPALAEAQRLLAELKVRHAGVENDWRTLRRLAREAEPVLYVGGTDSADMVLDLRRLEASRTRLRVTSAAARRASEMTY